MGNIKNKDLTPSVPISLSIKEAFFICYYVQMYVSDGSKHVIYSTPFTRPHDFIKKNTIYILGGMILAI